MREQQRVAAQQAPFLEDKRGVDACAHSAGGAGVALAALAEAGNRGGVSGEARGVPPNGQQEADSGDASPDGQIGVEVKGGARRQRDWARRVADHGDDGVENILHGAGAGFVFAEARNLAGDKKRGADQAAEDLRRNAGVLGTNEREEDAREHQRRGGGEERQQQNGGREADPGPAAEERQPNAHGGDEDEVEDPDIDGDGAHAHDDNAPERNGRREQKVEIAALIERLGDQHQSLAEHEREENRDDAANDAERHDVRCRGDFGEEARGPIAAEAEEGRHHRVEDRAPHVAAFAAGAEGAPGQQHFVAEQKKNAAGAEHQAALAPTSCR